jgi:hypothetical protein
MGKEELIIAAEGRCADHLADHSFRVMKLAREIFEKQIKIDGPKKVRQNPDFFLDILDWTAVLHDREMREDLVYDLDHGIEAAVKVDEIVGNEMTEEGKEMIRFLCVYHVPNDNIIPGITETQLWLLRVFKDADSLDRVRFENGDKLDEKFLRTESAKGLIEKSRELWEKTKQEFNTPKLAFDAVFENNIE